MTNLKKWIPLTAICLGAFMLLVDVSIVNVALPKMATDLGTSFTSLQWVVDIYALTLAALLMAFGSLGDAIGHRRLYVSGLVLFAAASLACALAPDAGFLIASRAVQGVGGAAMMTSTTSLIASSYQGRDLGIAFSVWGAVNGAAAAVGPILGGILTDAFGWRAIFMVNVPVAVAAVALTLRHLHADKPAPARTSGRFDLPGAITFTVLAAGVVYALIEGNDKGWGSAWVLVPFAVSAAAVPTFVLVERRARRPLLDLSLLRNPSFTGLTLGGLLLTAGAFAQLTYTSIWLQQVLHMTPLKAGLTLGPLAGVAFVVALVAGRFTHRMAPQLPVGIGLVLIGAGTLMLRAVGSASDWTALTPGFVVAGIGVGLATPMLTAAALASVSRERAGMASGAVATGRQLGYALGIAVLGTVFQKQLNSFPVHTDPHVMFASALDRIYLVAGLAALAAAVMVFALVRRPRAVAPAQTAPVPAEEPTTAPV